MKLLSNFALSPDQAYEYMNSAMQNNPLQAPFIPQQPVDTLLEMRDKMLPDSRFQDYIDNWPNKMPTAIPGKIRELGWQTGNALRTGLDNIYDNGYQTGQSIKKGMSDIYDNGYNAGQAIKGIKETVSPTLNKISNVLQDGGTGISSGLQELGTGIKERMSGNIQGNIEQFRHGIPDIPQTLESGQPFPVTPPKSDLFNKIGLGAVTGVAAPLSASAGYNSGKYVRSKIQPISQ